MVALLAMGILVLVCGALLAAVITLIAIPATRKAGWILFAFLVGVPLLLLPLAGLWIFLERSGPAPERRLLARDDLNVIRQMNQQASWQGPKTARDAVVQTTPAAPRIIPPTPPQSQPWDEDTLINGFYISIDPPSNSSPAQHPTETPATAPAEKQPIDKALTAESARLIDSLSKVLAKTILENPKTWQDFVAKAARQPDAPPAKDAPLAEAPLGNKPASAAPASPPIAPSDPAKPDWVDQPLHQEGSDVWVSVAVEPFETLVESEAALPEAVQNKAIVPYLEYFMPEGIGKVRLSPHVLKNLVVKRWVEKRSIVQGEVQILHALVQIDRSAKNEINEAYRQSLVTRRLWPLGMYFSAGFLLLAAVWGYLKIDLATGGARRGILRTAVSIVILSIAAAVAIAIRA
jgi:hypothetical protein